MTNDRARFTWLGSKRDRLYPIPRKRRIGGNGVVRENWSGRFPSRNFSAVRRLCVTIVKQNRETCPCGEAERGRDHFNAASLTIREWLLQGNRSAASKALTNGSKGPSLRWTDLLDRVVESHLSLKARSV